MKYLALHEEKSLVGTVREIKGSKAERDWFMIELLLGTGLRLSELHGLNVGDLRGKEKLYVRPDTAKFGKGRFIPVSVHLQKRCKAFLALKMKQGELIRDDSPLFVSRFGERLSQRSIQEAVEGWMIRAGLTTTRNGKTTPLYSVHSLRHTCFQRMRERGVALQAIQKIAGHASLASTGIYTEATWEECVEAVEARG